MAPQDENPSGVSSTDPISILPDTEEAPAPPPANYKAILADIKKAEEKKKIIYAQKRLKELEEEIAREEESQAQHEIGVGGTHPIPVATRETTATSTPTVISAIDPSDSVSVSHLTPATQPDRERDTTVLAMPYRRNIKLADPKPYKGKSIEECKMFIDDCQRQFVFGAFTSETEKIMYAQSRVAGRVKMELNQRGGFRAFENSTLAEWEEFLLNCVADPATRAQQYTDEYLSTVQGEKQTVIEYTNHLEGLEREIGPFTKIQLIRRTIAGLRPELRKALNRSGRKFENRRELVDFAAQIEYDDKPNLRRRRDSQSSSDESERDRKRKKKNKSNFRNNKSKSRNAERPPSGPKSESKQSESHKSFMSRVICTKCNRSGHYATRCPSLNKKDNEAQVKRTETVPGKAQGSTSTSQR